MTANFTDWVAICETKARYPEISFDDDGQGANVIWAMQDRNTWDEARRAQTGHAGHTGYGHYRERHVKCPDGRWRIKSLNSTVKWPRAVI